MTPDEIVEAMARGMWEASDAPTYVPYDWDRLHEDTRARMREHARAALRALPPGVVLVAGVPHRIRRTVDAVCRALKPRTPHDV